MRVRACVCQCASVHLSSRCWIAVETLSINVGEEDADEKKKDEEIIIGGWQTSSTFILLPFSVICGSDSENGLISIAIELPFVVQLFAHSLARSFSLHPFTTTITIITTAIFFCFCASPRLLRTVDYTANA